MNDVTTVVINLKEVEASQLVLPVLDQMSHTKNIGKSLSLICSSTTWLRQHQNKSFQQNLHDEAVDNEPDWIVDHARQQKQREAVQRRSYLSARLAEARAKEEGAKARYESGEPLHKKLKKADVELENADDAFCLDDYDSEDDTRTGTLLDAQGLSLETQALMEKLGVLVKSRTDEVEVVEEVKVFYCSRTHSQLSQFIDELRRVKRPLSIETDTTSDSQDRHNVSITDNIKHITLGSRKNLCINPKVSHLSNVHAINERCLELQQPIISRGSKCPYVPDKENKALMNDFRDHAMAKIRDIEDFSKLGRKLGICPYYASRTAINSSEIITLPYPLLLQKAARESLGLSLKGQIVIIDEAHNLVDAITGIYSVSITLQQLKQSQSQLISYLQKFRSRLKGKNRAYVTQLARLLGSIVEYLVKAKELAACTSVEGLVKIGDFMSGKGVDQINMYKLMRYLQESKLPYKVERYTTHATLVGADTTTGENMSPKQSRHPATTPVLAHVQSFLLALTYPAAEGRFFLSKTSDGDVAGGEICLKYLLLDPTNHFRELVDDARAVILAGGTMSPMADYINHLLHYLPLERIKTLSCSHVIPPSNLLATTVSSGPSGIDLNFTFDKRSSERMILELGHTIYQMIGIIPDGVVVFFPSYAYLDTAVRCWRETKPSIWDLFCSQKAVFLEPGSTTSSPPQSVDGVLYKYTSVINEGNGALLLAVVGGSLSEGINFSDRLGRCVAVVGLPFPNQKSPEWKAKLEFIEQRSRGSSADAAREFYENSCMRAVNQSIGRAIRHKDDYAAIMLLDRRYERDNIKGKLPGWIQTSMNRQRSTFDDVRERLKGFFAAKR